MSTTPQDERKIRSATKALFKTQQINYFIYIANRRLPQFESVNKFYDSMKQILSFDEILLISKIPVTTILQLDWAVLDKAPLILTTLIYSLTRSAEKFAIALDDLILSREIDDDFRRRWAWPVISKFIGFAASPTILFYYTHRMEDIGEYSALNQIAWAASAFKNYDVYFQMLKVYGGEKWFQKK